MLSEVVSGRSFQASVCLFGDEWIQSAAARLGRVYPRMDFDFEETQGSFNIVELGRRVETSKYRVGSTDGSGVPTSSSQHEKYATKERGPVFAEIKKSCFFLSSSSRDRSSVGTHLGDRPGLLIGEQSGMLEG